MLLAEATNCSVNQFIWSELSKIRRKIVYRFRCLRPSAEFSLLFRIQARDKMHELIVVIVFLYA